MLDYLIPVAAYLLGSLSSAVIVARLMGLRDPREVGSKNPGATNILRYGGKKAAIATLAGDMLKGVIAVWVARLLATDPGIIGATMVAAFLGHLYPVFFSFKGGKGVATALGAYLGVNLGLGLAVVATWLVTAVITRYSSLSALVATALAPFYTWYFLGAPAYIVAVLVIAVILFWRHRSNIRNLRDGSENKIGHKPDVTDLVSPPESSGSQD
jgi:glycerol-3-phosphate acyltransferase PlsY